MPSSYVHPSRRKRVSRIQSKTKRTSETTQRHDGASVSEHQSASQSVSFTSRGILFLVDVNEQFLLVCVLPSCESLQMLR